MGKKNEITCKSCGGTFLGWYGTKFCPVCQKNRKTMEVVKERVCRTCEDKFLGGPRAWYCPSCRVEREKERKRINNYKHAHGLTRRLGTIDNCVACGGEYTVNSGLQKYCHKCAPEEVKKIDNAQAMDYYLQNRGTSNPKRNSARKLERFCADCGVTITPIGGRYYCETCRKKRKNKEKKIEEGIYKREGSFLVRIYYDKKLCFVKSTTNYDKAVSVRDIANKKKEDGTFMEWLHEFKVNGREN